MLDNCGNLGMPQFAQPIWREPENWDSKRILLLALWVPYENLEVEGNGVFCQLENGFELSRMEPGQQNRCKIRF